MKNPKTEWVPLRRADEAPSPIARVDEEPLRAPRRRRHAGPRDGASATFRRFSATARTGEYRRVRRTERAWTFLLGGCLVVAATGAAAFLALGIVWIVS